MEKRRPTFQLHDPNEAETTACCLLKILVQSNQQKVELAFQAAGRPREDHTGRPESHSI